MELLHSLESKIADVAKGLPHLPKEFSKWLADNAWWLTLIGVVLGVLAIFPLLAGTIFVSSVVSVYDVYYPARSGAIQASLWASLGFYVLLVAIEALAISPLKGHKKLGWDLLFLAVLVSAIFSVVNAVITYSAGALLGGAIGLAIGLYVLFEIRSHFVKK